MENPAPAYAAKSVPSTLQGACRRARSEGMGGRHRADTRATLTLSCRRGVRLASGGSSYSRPVHAFGSVSTWLQPEPARLSVARTGLVSDVAARVSALGPGRLRVAIDGSTAAGKTSFGHELAAGVRALGRPTLRASLDDFKKPWREARELGYDRVSGEGYYRNTYDFGSARELLFRRPGRWDLVTWSCAPTTP